MKSLRIGVLGLGTVGAGTVRLLARNREMAELKSGVHLTVHRALVRDLHKNRDLGGAAPELTTDPSAILEDPGVDIVVEALGGIEPARDYILRALRAGKPVVTANKDVVAQYGADIFAAAAAGGSEIFFEASVGGGIPIIRPLKESLGANRIQSMMGIVNGTTNYILSRMTQEGMDFAVALAQAQELGYAEPDPTNDVGGLDAGRKLAILSSIGFLSRVLPGDVYTEGISGVSARDIEHGRRLGWVVKLLAIAKQSPAGIEARVHPTFISQLHPLASVSGALNAIFVSGDAVGDTMFYGRGAGAEPTASSVAGDVIAAARGLQARRLLAQGGLDPAEAAAAAWTGGALQCTCYLHKPICPMGDVVTRYYLRLDVADRPGVLAKVAGAFGAAGVSIAHLYQTPDEERGTAEIMAVTHRVAERQIEVALDNLRQVPELNAVASRLRIEA